MLGLQNDFKLLRILNYWSLNYQGFTVYVAGLKDVENCSQVTVHQLFIFVHGYSTPNSHRVYLHTKT